MKRLVFTFLFLFSGVLVFSQNPDINQLDEHGLKTGVWKKYYENGNLMYEGMFKSGKPVGLLTRFYEGGVKKAEMTFFPDGTSYAKLYYENRDLAAEGKYMNKLKDSTWNYYSFFNQRLAMKEQYSSGKKDGYTIKYYDNHEVAEKIRYENDTLHGPWEQFYENGQIRLKCEHLKGRRNGKFESFASDGSLSITGQYKNGIMDGQWVYYKEGNTVDLELIYKDGKMMDNPEYERRQKEFSKLLDESSHSISEPKSIDFR